MFKAESLRYFKKCQNLIEISSVGLCFFTGKSHLIVSLSFFPINQFNSQSTAQTIISFCMGWPGDQGYVVYNRPTARQLRGRSRRKSANVVIRLQRWLRKEVWVDGWVHKTPKRIYRTAFSLFPPSVNLLVLTWTQFLPYRSHWRQSFPVLKKRTYFNPDLDPSLNYKC